jgi:predicted alpha/beta-hydrolase family hydrolase
VTRTGSGVTVATSYGEALILLDPLPDPAFLIALTHGAGGGVDAPDLLATRDAALAAGGAVARVVQPYRVRGSRAPGSPARQDAAWIEVIAALQEMTAGMRGGPTAAAGARQAPEPGGPGQARGRGGPGRGMRLILGGRSNGARLACRTAPAVRADAVIALAFPLHPPGHPERSRRDELLAAGVEVLAVSGSKDPFGIPAAADAAQVVVLAGEGHTFAKNPAAVGAAVSAWLRLWLSRSG